MIFKWNENKISILQIKTLNTHHGISTKLSSVFQNVYNNTEYNERGGEKKTNEEFAGSFIQESDREFANSMRLNEKTKKKIETIETQRTQREKNEWAREECAGSF